MLSQALDKLVIALEAGLVLNPEVLDQSDVRKRAYWRDTLCPALQEAKAAKAQAINIEELVLIAGVMERTLRHASVVRQLASVADLPSGMVEEYTRDSGEIQRVLTKVGKVIDRAAVETLVS